MPTIIKRSTLSLADPRREVRRALSWHSRAQIWSPPMDAYETDDAYVVRMEIAGMRESDFEVLIADTTLLISGARSDSSERRAFHQMEVQFGKFSTAIGIPGAFDIEHAIASYENGFLIVKLPKPNSNSTGIG